MDIFGNVSFLGQRAYREFMAARRGEQQQEQQRDPPPAPASRKAVRQLPTVVVTPEDLVDPNNRECCICLEEYVGSKRVPVVIIILEYSNTHTLFLVPLDIT
jgi:hypothetical protein